MMHNIISGKQNIWNERLKMCLDEKKYTQTAFVKKLNEKYRTEEEGGKQFTQPTVHDWLYVGYERRPGEAAIGFPKFENMLLIADFFGVDIGYLIGETDAETFTLEKASDFLHLEPDALKNYTHNIYVKYNECSSVLNRLLRSEYFDDFIYLLKELEDTYIKYKNMIPDTSESADSDLNSAYLSCLFNEISKKYGQDVFEKALEHQDDACPSGLTDTECNALKEVNAAIDKGYDFSCNFKKEMGYSRFLVQESLVLLLNDIYPISVDLRDFF